MMDVSALNMQVLYAHYDPATGCGNEAVARDKPYQNARLDLEADAKQLLESAL